MKYVFGLGIVIIFCLYAFCFPVIADTDPYANYHVNTGDQVTDLIAVAKTQIGYIEGSLTGDVYGNQDGIHKYGVWYDETVENIGAATYVWDATFVSWCADQADIPDTVIPRYVYTPYSVAWFESEGLFQTSQNRGGTYIPKKGDLIFFGPEDGTTATKMGIVTDVTDKYVCTVEGNAHPISGEPETQGVFAKSYSLSYARIYGYATPLYVVNPYANTYVNTGDGANDLIGVAETQVGYVEGTLEGSSHINNNYQKYGVWYDETVENIGAANADWAGSFVAWCAEQADIPDTVIPRYAYLPYSVAWFENKGLFEASQSQGGGYIPKKGDLIFFGDGSATHMGIVVDATDTYVCTIEGNVTDPTDAYGLTQGVFKRQYNVNYSRIYGYATPRYALVWDITGDGHVSTSDVRELLLCVLNNSAQKQATMDVDKNGEINTVDARILLINVIQNASVS